MRYKNRKIKDSTGFTTLDDIVELIVDSRDEYTDEDGEIDENELDRTISETIDSQLIYDSDLWAIMKHYQQPREADLNEAIELFYNDVYSEVHEELGI